VGLFGCGGYATDWLAQLMARDNPLLWHWSKGKIAVTKRHLSTRSMEAQMNVMNFSHHHLPAVW
jgi:hypothetical protein